MGERVKRGRRHNWQRGKSDPVEVCPNCGDTRKPEAPDYECSMPGGKKDMGTPIDCPDVPADFTKCGNEKCPLKRNCLRYLAAPKSRQVWAEFTPNDNGTCDSYVDYQRVLVEP